MLALVLTFLVLVLNFSKDALCKMEEVSTISVNSWHSFKCLVRVRMCTLSLIQNRTAEMMLHIFSLRWVFVEKRYLCDGVAKLEQLLLFAVCWRSPVAAVEITDLFRLGHSSRYYVLYCKFSFFEHDSASIVLYFVIIFKFSKRKIVHFIFLPHFSKSKFNSHFTMSTVAQTFCFYCSDQF